MSQPTANPCYVAGTTRASGSLQTGEVNITRGGGRTACVWSGSLLTNAALTGAFGAVQSGGQILLFSGAGRLNNVIVHQLTSGETNPVWFYDAGAITVSGRSVSGQRIIGTIPQLTGTLISGNIQAPIFQMKLDLDMPFSSGLCVGAASGTPGFTVSFTPEVSAAFPNP